MVQGLVAGLVAAAVIYALVRWLGRGSDLLTSMLDMRLVWASLAGTVLLGVLLCVLSTLIVVSRVAYITKDDLYY